MGLRPDLLRQVVQKRAVHDAGGSSPVRHEGRFTDTRTRPCLWNFHATPQAWGRKLRQGRSRLVVGVLTLPHQGTSGETITRGCRVGLKADLDSYAALHAQTYGETVDAATLSPHMLEAFMAGDHEFRKGTSAKVAPPKPS